MKQILKKILLALFYYSGLFEVMRRISIKKGFVPILLYHRILDEGASRNIESCFFLLGIGISKGLFEKQLAYLKQKYKVISLQEYAQKKKQGACLSGYAVVTFDDGFKDSGLALLKKYGIPATIFLIGEAFEKIFWRHRIFLMLDEASIKKTVFKAPSGQEIALDLSTAKAKREAISVLVGAGQRLDEKERERFFDELKRQLGITKDFTAPDVYLTGQDIRGSLPDGISFGAHSQTHRNLALLSDEEISVEISASKGIVERLTQEKNVPFAIPFGKYDERVVRALKEQGVLCSVTSDNGFDSKEGDMYRMKRIYVNTRDFREFVYKLSGLEAWGRP
jgi:peptidoglycan/xylan/chitin deacetylase (PgdA/CDA1 family)